MRGYSRSLVRIEDPYAFLTLNFFLEVFRTIKCYYFNQGTIEDKLEGRDNIQWIRKMRGNFRILATAYNGELEDFHQECIKKINEIKHEAHEHYLVEKTHQRVAIS